MFLSDLNLLLYCYLQTLSSHFLFLGAFGRVYVGLLLSSESGEEQKVFIKTVTGMFLSTFVLVSVLIAWSDFLYVQILENWYENGKTSSNEVESVWLAQLGRLFRIKS